MEGQSVIFMSSVLSVCNIFMWLVSTYVNAGSGQCDRFCSKISGLAGIPMMP